MSIATKVPAVGLLDLTTMIHGSQKQYQTKDYVPIRETMSAERFLICSIYSLSI